MFTSLRRQVFGSPSSVPAANYFIAASYNKSFPGALPHSLGAIKKVHRLRATRC